MGFRAEEFSSAAGLRAGREGSGLDTKSTITTTMGTGTGSQPRAWTA